MNRSPIRVLAFLWTLVLLAPQAPAYSGDRIAWLDLPDFPFLGTFSIKEKGSDDWKPWGRASGRVDIPEGAQLRASLSMLPDRYLHEFAKLRDAPIVSARLGDWYSTGDRGAASFAEILSYLPRLSELSIREIGPAKIPLAIAAVLRHPGIERLTIDLGKKPMDPISLDLEPTIDPSHLRELTINAAGQRLTITKRAAEIGGLGSLESLTLKDARPSAETFENLAQAPRLKRIQITRPPEKVYIREGLFEADRNCPLEPQVDEEIISALAKTSAVRELLLQNMALSADSLDRLAAMDQLESLIVFGCDTPNKLPGPLSKLRNLRELTINGGFPEQEISELLGRSNLKSMRLIGGLVDASDQSLVDRLLASRTLEAFRLTLSRDGDAIESPGSIQSSSLRELSLNAKISPNFLHSLERLTQLRSLILIGLEPSQANLDISLTQLASLETIDILASGPLAHGLVSALGTLPALRTLRIWAHSIDGGLDSLPRSLENLELSVTDFTERDIHSLGALKGLRSLTLRGSALGSLSQFQALSSLSHLQDLDLWHLHLNPDTAVAWIASLPALLSLKVPEELTNDEVFGSLPKLIALRALWVDGVPLSPAGKRALLGMEHLRFLNVDASRSQLDELRQTLVRTEISDRFEDSDVPLRP